MTDVIDLGKTRDKVRRAAGHDNPGETEANTRDGEVHEGVVVFHPAADPASAPQRPAEAIRALTSSEAKADPGTGDEHTDPAAGVVLVDGATGGAGEDKTPPREQPRRDVIPAWARDRQQAKDLATWAASYYGHHVAFHALRLPLYWWRLAARSPIGLAKIVTATAGWVLDSEHREARHSIVKTAGASEYVRLVEQRRAQTRGRAILVAITLLAIAGMAMVVGQSSWFGQLVVVATTLAGLGAVGRKDGVRITGRATDVNTVPRLTAELITRALGSLRIAEMKQALAKEARGGERAIGFPSPITRDGPGWRADIDLPGGVTAAEVTEKRENLASGLRRPEGCVWPEVDRHQHAGRLVLYVSDRSLSNSEKVPWKLAERGKVNVFEPIPVGVDQRGRPVTMTMIYASGLVGAVPRMGKTFAARLLLLAASLDPRVEIHAHDLKGGTDFKPMKPVAHALRSGDDDEDIEYLARDVAALRADMRRRYRTIDTLPGDVCPEGKTTDELASDRSLGLHPVLLVIDECGAAFEHSKYGKQIRKDLTALVKRGPAAGIMVWLLTQRPDSQSIPTSISAMAVLRLAMKVIDHQANDMILGSGMYKAGTRATMFSFDDKGIALMVGEGADPRLVRLAYIDAKQAEAVAARARAARAAANRLTGLAAGEDLPAEEPATVLDHLLEVWPSTEPKAWCDDLAARLAAAHPALYEGWEGVQVTTAVQPHGLTTMQVKRVIDGRQINKRGLSRAAVLDALGDRYTNSHSSGDSSGQEVPTDDDL